MIGGADIYAAALPLADGLVLTEIDRDYDGDTRFPAMGPGRLARDAERIAHVGRRRSFRFVLYEKT